MTFPVYRKFNRTSRGTKKVAPGQDENAQTRIVRHALGILFCVIFYPHLDVPSSGEAWSQVSSLSPLRYVPGRRGFSITTHCSPICINCSYPTRVLALSAMCTSNGISLLRRFRWHLFSCDVFIGVIAGMRYVLGLNLRTYLVTCLSYL